MPGLRRSAPRALLRCLRASAVPALGRPGRLPLGILGPVRYASTKGDEDDEAPGRSFRGQMNNSIVARMQREKAERERAARDKTESASTRNLGTTFGKTASSPCPPTPPTPNAMDETAPTRRLC